MVLTSGYGNSPRAVRGTVDSEWLAQNFLVINVTRPVGVISVGKGSQANTQVFVVQCPVIQIFLSVTLGKQGNGAKNAVGA